MELKTDAEILAETREYIEEHGWTQGTIQDRTKRVCSLGGILFSQGWVVNVDGAWSVPAEYRPDVQRVVAKVLNALGVKPHRVPDPDIPRVLPEDIPYEYIVSGLTTWNDAKALGQQQVLDVFAKAEKIERAGYDPDK